MSGNETFAAEKKPLICLKDVCYAYPQASAKALNQISFSVLPGEYIAVVGSNGSGKSTLSRLIAGFFEPDSGSLELADGVIPGIVFQQPKEQIVAGVVERDTAFGPQNLEMTRDEVELRTMECLSVVGLADRASSRTFELSLGQTQRLAFSGILALFPDLLILDEVTAMLDPKARDEIISFVEQWHKKGHTIIHVTHDQKEALSAGRIIALDGGSIVFDGSSADFMADTKTFTKVFREDAELFDSSVDLGKLEELPVALRAEGISFSYPDRQVFSKVNLELRKGTLTALTGPSGCGKSTLLECLAGLKQCSEGHIYSDQRPALSLQESDAALFAPYAADDVAFGAQNRGVEGKALLERVKNSMHAVGLDYKEFGNRRTFQLSGGEKRKLSIAGILALDSQVILFDEPTSALDSTSRITVMKCLKDLAASGKTVLFSTHRMEEADMADVSLNWETLTSTVQEPVEKEGQTAATTDLPEQKCMESASLIVRLQKAAGAFMAPPKIPDSPVSRMGDLAKFIVFLALFIGSLAVIPTAGVAALLFLSIIYALLARYPLTKPLRAYLKILPWLVFFAAIQFFFYQNNDTQDIMFQWKWFVMTRGKLLLLIKTFIRAPAIIITVGTFVFSTNERQILDGLSSLLKPLAMMRIPVRYVVLVTGIIFRFIPLLIDELCGIVKTQMVRGVFGNARGFAKIKILVPLFSPLMLQTFRKAQYLADALTARYFK